MKDFIEDVSERYVPLYSTERDNDTVKRVNIAKYIPCKEEDETENAVPKIKERKSTEKCLKSNDSHRQ